MLMPIRPNGTAMQAGLTLSCFKTPCSAYPPSVLSKCPALGANVELIWRVHLQHQQLSSGVQHRMTLPIVFISSNTVTAKKTEFILFFIIGILLYLEMLSRQMPII